MFLYEDGNEPLRYQMQIIPLRSVTLYEKTTERTRMEGLINTLTIIGGLAISIAAALGAGNLLLAIYQRWTGKQDKERSLHESNSVAELDHDDKFQERLLRRVTILEKEIKQMQQEQIAQARLHTKLELENTTLKHENEYQQAELAALRATDAERLERIRHLETQVVDLTAAVEILNKRSLLDANDMQKLLDNCKIIQDAIHRLGFVPTGTPSDDDNAAVQRLKEIREASERIAEIVV